MAVALIVAAGRGERLGSDSPKALVELAGRSLLQWSVDLMVGLGVESGVEGGGDGERVERVVVALPPGVAAPPGAVGVEGGAVRSESVARALRAAGPGAPGEMIVVHDAARPLASAELVRRTLRALVSDESLDAAIAAAPVSDTVKRVQAQPGAGRGAEPASGGPGVVIETLDRSTLWAVQTPQVFRRSSLERALDVQGEILAQATDDAWLIERLGGRVAVVPSERSNLKITTALDLALAELLIARRPA